MLKYRLPFLPTKSVLVSLCFLVLIGCDAEEDACNPFKDPPPPKVDLVQADKSAMAKLREFQAIQDLQNLSKVMEQWIEQHPISIPAVTPVDQATSSPPRTAGASPKAVRAAASTPPTGTVIYILDAYGALDEFDPVSNTVVATLDFSQATNQPFAQRLALTPDRSLALITVNSSQTATSAVTSYVLVADLTTFKIASTIQLPAGTVVGGLAITPDGKLAYVVTSPYSGSGPSNVFVIDVATRTIKLTIPVNSDSNLAQIAMTPDGTEAYLVDSIDGGNFAIPVLDLQSNTVQPSVSIFYGTGKNLISSYSPSYIAMHPDGTRLYLMPITGGPVLIVSTIFKTVTNAIPLAPGAGPVFGSQPTFTPDGIHLAFTSGMNLVVFVNTLTDTVESTITLAPPPFEPTRNLSFFFLPKQ